MTHEIKELIEHNTHYSLTKMKNRQAVLLILTNTLLFTKNVHT